MAAFSIVCTSCKAYIEVPDKFAQPFIKCPSCSKMSKVTYPSRTGPASTTGQRPAPPAGTSSQPASPAAAPAPSPSVPAAPTASAVSGASGAPTGHAPAPGSGEKGLLNQLTYLVRERVGFLKMCDVYDIFDPQTQKQIGIAKEEPASWLVYLRFLVNKRLLPTVVNVYESEENAPLFSINKGVQIFRSRVEVRNTQGDLMGYFVSKMFSLGGGFYVYDTADKQVAEVSGDWKGWNFTFKTTDGKELGSVSKQWAGVAKELFTSADNYVIGLKPIGAGQKTLGALLLAAGLAIDVIFKEH